MDQDPQQVESDELPAWPAPADVSSEMLEQARQAFQRTRAPADLHHFTQVLLGMLHRALDAGDVRQQDKFIEDLRQLRHKFATDRTVAEALVMAVDLIVDDPHGDSDEYWQAEIATDLSHTVLLHPDFALAKHVLAKAIAKGLPELMDRDLAHGALHHLARIVKDAPEDINLAAHFAACLLRVLKYFPDGEDARKRDRILRALTKLQGMWPKEHYFALHLASALSKELEIAVNESLPVRRDRLQKRMRSLLQACDKDPANLSQLGETLRGLFTNDEEVTKPDEKTEARKAPEEPKAVVPSASQAVEWAAKKILDDLLRTRAPEDVTSRSHLLGELRQMVLRELNSHSPVSDEVLKCHCTGLNHVLMNAWFHGNLRERDQVARELQRWAAGHPDHPATVQAYSDSLLHLIRQAACAGDWPEITSLLARLQTVKRDFPSEAGIRDNATLGLYIALILALDTGDLPRRESFLKDLRVQAEDGPAEATACQFAAMGVLACAFDEASKPGGSPKAYIDELAGMMGKSPDTDGILACMFDEMLPDQQEGEPASFFGTPSIEWLRTVVKAEVRQWQPPAAQSEPEAKPEPVRRSPAPPISQTAMPGVFPEEMHTLKEALAARPCDHYRVLDALEALLELARDHPENIILQQRLAVALSAAIQKAYQEENYEMLHTFLGEYSHFAETSSNTPEALEAVCQELNVLVSLAIQRNDQNLLSMLMDEARLILERNPNQVSAVEALALALSMDIVEEGEEDCPDQILAEIGELAARHPESFRITMTYGKALQRAIRENYEADLPTIRLAKMWLSFCQLVHRHAEQPPVALLFLETTMSHLEVLLADDGKMSGDEVLSFAIHLGTVRGKDQETGRAVGTLLCQLVKHGQEVVDLESVESHLAKLRSLSGKFDDDALVAESLATALVHAGEAVSEPARREAIAEEIRQLDRRHPHTTGILQALGTVLAAMAGEAGGQASRSRALDELRNQLACHPDKPMVRLHLARGLENAVIRSALEENWSDINSYVEELGKLAGKFPSETALRTHWAAGIHAGICLSFKTGDGQRRSQLTALLKDRLFQPAGAEENPKLLAAVQLLDVFEALAENPEQAESAMVKLKVTLMSAPESVRDARNSWKILAGSAGSAAPLDQNPTARHLGELLDDSEYL